jgi:hypothetical protein
MGGKNPTPQEILVQLCWCKTGAKEPLIQPVVAPVRLTPLERRSIRNIKEEKVHSAGRENPPKNGLQTDTTGAQQRGHVVKFSLIPLRVSALTVDACRGNRVPMRGRRRPPEQDWPMTCSAGPWVLYKSVSKFIQGDLMQDQVVRERSTGG